MIREGQGRAGNGSLEQGKVGHGPRWSWQGGTGQGKVGHTMLKVKIQPKMPPPINFIAYFFICYQDKLFL